MTVTMPDGYTITFTPVNYGEFKTIVMHNDLFVAERRECKSWWWAVRWGRRRVREHRRAMRKVVQPL
jgi:hypothetical protein